VKTRLAILLLPFWTLWGGPTYPGPAPGAVDLFVKDGRIVLRNRALTATWQIGEGGLPSDTGRQTQPRSSGVFSGQSARRLLRDAQSRQTLALTGEVFQIVLANGQGLDASTLQPDGEPRVGRLTPDPKAARLASRLPGRQIEIPLRSNDGAVRVVWRALAHDGANYVREELEIVAATSDVTIREISWLNEPVPGARRVGRVDGSPLVAGPFFFGYEDPMAMNAVGSSGRVVGTWSPEDVALGPPRRKTWSLDPALLKAGTNEFVFVYQRGPHRLDIDRVALIQDGQEIVRDEHHGRTGVEHVDNEYRLPLARVDPLAQYALAADLGTDPALTLPAGRSVDSHGEVRLTEAAGSAVCRLQRDATLRRGGRLTQSFVWGVAPAGQMRRAFLCYVERERAHPYRPFLHYNSWYDIAWHPFALNQTNCLEAIRLTGERFIQPYGVVMDALVFDDGWDDPQTLWRFHRGFPNGFTPLAELCRQYQTRLGVWLSPFGGYGQPRAERLKFGGAQGYETNATGFSLAGPKYYAAFKQACVGMIRDYGVNHFKFDGIASGMYASGSGADYILDTEAMRRLMLELRREYPAVYINLTTGSWPSPFWLRYADSVWRQGGDMGHAGKGPKQQQWLTYRDQEVYRNIVREGPLFPLNSLMTQGVAYSREGMAGDATFNAAGFRDDVRAFFGAGTSLQELYIQPGKLTPEDWRVLAEAARWSRANAAVLDDTHWIGGDPSNLEVYGYASWSLRKAIVMLRNPNDQPQPFALEVGSAFELPPGARARFELRSPWAEDRGNPPLTARAGKPLMLTLQPFQVLVLETTPTRL